MKYFLIRKGNTDTRALSTLTPVSFVNCPNKETFENIRKKGKILFAEKSELEAIAEKYKLINSDCIYHIVELSNVETYF